MSYSMQIHQESKESLREAVVEHRFCVVATEQEAVLAPYPLACKSQCLLAGMTETNWDKEEKSNEEKSLCISLSTAGRLCKSRIGHANVTKKMDTNPAMLSRCCSYQRYLQMFLQSIRHSSSESVATLACGASCTSPTTTQTKQLLYHTFQQNRFLTSILQTRRSLS